jgi:hypothetical protein
MPGLDPGIHSVTVEVGFEITEWMAGSSPAMTIILRTVAVFLSKRKGRLPAALFAAR